ncbi:hypothetical protein GOBAR_DD14384 [Gossypium barbadense]|nr:hypothetical protein GOBAR_DD14384 [Gossypium barbadense]
MDSNMETSSSLTSLEDKATKKVHMHCNGAGEDDHLMVVDDDGNRIGFEKFTTSRVSFKDMLPQELFHGDVTKGIEDDLPSIRFSTRKSILMSIGETIGQVIKLDDNTGNAHRGRWMVIFNMLSISLFPTFVFCAGIFVIEELLVHFHPDTIKWQCKEITIPQFWLRMGKNQIRLGPGWWSTARITE